MCVQVIDMFSTQVLLPPATQMNRYIHLRPDDDSYSLKAAAPPDGFDAKTYESKSSSLILPL